MDIELRYATAADAEAVAALVAEMAATFGETPEMDASYVPVYLDHPGNRILLAEVGGGGAGILAYSVRPGLYHGGPSGQIGEVVVSAARRGAGIGEAMLRRALADLEEAGCVEISLSVLPENKVAQRLYRRLGLTEESLQLERHLR